MENFRYKVELIEELPDCMDEIEKVVDIEAKKEWFGHSLGTVVGRIYTDGRVQSFFRHDIDAGKPEWFEMLLVADEGLKRYVTDTVYTEGSGAYCLADVMSSLEDIFEQWACEDEKGFRFCDGQLNVDFYDDFGETVDIDFPCTVELVNCINSVRIVEMKKTIIK